MAYRSPFTNFFGTPTQIKQRNASRAQTYATQNANSILKQSKGSLGKKPGGGIGGFLHHALNEVGSAGAGLLGGFGTAAGDIIGGTVKLASDIPQAWSHIPTQEGMAQGAKTLRSIGSGIEKRGKQSNEYLASHATDKRVARIAGDVGAVGANALSILSPADLAELSKARDLGSVLRIITPGVKNPSRIAAETERAAQKSKVASGLTRTSIAGKLREHQKLLGTAQDNAASRIHRIDDELHSLSMSARSRFTPTRDMSGTPVKLTPAKFEKNLKNGMPVVAKGKTATFAPESGKFSAQEHISKWRSLMDERKALVERLHSSDRPATPEKVAAQVKIPNHVPKPGAPAVSADKAEATLDSVKAGGGQSVGAIRSLLGSKGGAVMNALGDSGKRIASMMRNIDNDAGYTYSHYRSQLPTYRKLSDAETATLHDVIKNGTTAPTDKIAKAADEVRNVLSQVEADAGRANVKVAHRSNYMPQIHTKESLDAIRKNPSKAIQHLVDTGQAKTTKEATDKLNAYLYSTGDIGKGETYGNLEKSRSLDLPGYRTDKNALMEYLDRSSHRISQATHFGANNEKVAAELQNIGLHNGDVGLAREAIKNYLRSPAAKYRKAGAGMNAVRAGFAASRLPYAALMHATQTANTAEVTGYTRMVSAWVKSALGKEAKAFADKAGVSDARELHGIQEQASGVTGKLGRTIAPGLTPVMRANRNAAAIAGRDYARYLAKQVGKGGKKGDRALQELRKFGVNGDIKGGTLSEEQEIRAARGVVDKTMFSRSRAGTPVGAETQLGRTVGQYRLSYAYKQTRHVYENLIQEARKGNLKPLIRHIAVTAPISYVTYELKNKISGRKEGTGGKWLDTLGALGGLPGEALVSGARYGTKDLTKFMASEVAPLAGEAVGATEAITNSIKSKSWAPVGRQALGYIPGEGSRVAATAFPYGNPQGRAVQNYSSKAVNSELKRVNYNIGTPDSNTSKRLQGLSKDQVNLYNDASSRLFAKGMDKALKSPDYQSLSDAGKKSAAEKIMGQSRTDILNAMGVPKPKATKSATSSKKAESYLQ